MKWLRLWHDMPNDPKWRTVARASGQPITAVVSVYVHLMVNASANATERGRTHGWNNEDVASALDLSTEAVESIIDAMGGRVMDGDRLTGWEKRQPKREDGAAERAKNWREESHQKTANATERNRTQPNAPDKDTDTDKERSKAFIKNEPEPMVVRDLLDVAPNLQNTSSPAAAGDARAHPPIAIESWFAEFWKIYWRKVGKDAARAKFRKRVKTLADWEVVKRALEVQRPEYMARDPDLRPHPATWLGQGRMFDEPAKPAIDAPRKKSYYDMELERLSGGSE